MVSNFGQLHVDIYMYLDTLHTISNSLQSRPQPFVDFYCYDQQVYVYRLFLVRVEKIVQKLHVQENRKYF